MPGGRPPLGPRLVDGLEGPDDEKERLKAILETIAGETPIAEASARLGISEPRFHQLRQRVLEAALEALAPGIPGRPRKEEDPTDTAARVAELQRQVSDLQISLRAAEVRTEIALAMPHLLKDELAKERPKDEDEKKKKSRPAGADADAGETKDAASDESRTEPPGTPAAKAEGTERRHHEDHVERVNEIMAAKHGERRGPKGAPPRRGLKGQRPRRQAERLVRRSALVFLRWLRLRGLSRADAARRLGLLETTVATWEDRWRRDHLEIQARGRTPDRGDRDLRMTVLGLFHFLGPDVGLPTLQAILPDAPRAELVELQRRYRFAHKRRSHCLIHALRWTLPGAVWAMDFAEPPAPIDARYPYVLVVRDLASGCQLEAMPCVEPDAALVISVLEALFAAHGAPLVLKSDNGSAFIAREVAALLDAHDVHHLLSPPGTPSYNGSVEAGIGSLKTRAHHEAARNDRPGEWTCDDVEAARRQANETARPNGHRQPTPLEAWQSRSPIEPSLRVDLTLVRDRYLEEARREKHLAPHALLDRHTEASIHRIALGRALVELGLLQHRRRRVPLRV